MRRIATADNVDKHKAPTYLSLRPSYFPKGFRDSVTIALTRCSRGLHRSEF